jgi:hypothetical protein
MACAAVAAVQLSLWKAVLLRDAVSMPPANMALMAVGQTLSAIGLTMALFSIRWQFQGYAALVQPGQIVLLGSAVSAFNFYLMLLSSILMRGPFDVFRARGSDDITAMIVSISMAIVYYGLSVLFYGWCAWNIADSLPWRLLFIWYAVGQMAFVPPVYLLVESMTGMPIRDSFNIVYIMRAALTLALLGLAVINDAAHGRPRYWTHWLGVVLLLSGSLLGLISGALYWASQL